MAMNNKGQGMSTNTIILLILGLVVLVALIWGFMTGWQGLRSVINPSNVDNVVQDCSAACAIQGTYSYCMGERTLRAVEDDLEIRTSCAVYASEPSLKKYGVQACPSIDCNLNCENVRINGERADDNLGGADIYHVPTSDGVCDI